MCSHKSGIKPNLSGRITLSFQTELVLKRRKTMLQKSALIYPSTSNCMILPRVHVGLKNAICFPFSKWYKLTMPPNLILQNALLNSVTLQPSGEKRLFFSVHVYSNAIYTWVSPSKPFAVQELLHQRSLPDSLISRGREMSNCSQSLPALRARSFPPFKDCV